MRNLGSTEVVKAAKDEEEDMEGENFEALLALLHTRTKRG